jgi:hypothetical protein
MLRTVMKRNLAPCILFFLAGLSVASASAAEKELLRMGQYRISMMEGSCAEEVELIIRAPGWEAFEKDAEIQQASIYAEYDVQKAGCGEFQSFRVKGYANNVLVYEGITARATNWVPEGGLVEGTDRTPTPPPVGGVYGLGTTPARELIEIYASVDAPSLDEARCGPFVLRDPLGGQQGTTAEAVITKLAGGNLDALIGGGRYRQVLNNISTQRNDYNLRCQAAILLERDSICTDEDFDCAVVSSCTQFMLPHIGEEGRARFPSCINTATRRVAEQRQRVLAAELVVEGVSTELIIAKFPGADEQLGDWCGESLYGIVNWPRGFNATPSLARTVADIINQSLSARCPRAKTLVVRVDRFSTSGSRRNFSGSEQFLRAFLESGVWNVAFHEDFLQQQRARATLDSFWNTIKAMGNYPGGVVMATSLNEAMAAQQRSRFAEYAREGKVCQMRDAVRHCYVSTTWTTGYGGRIGRTMIMTSTPTRHSSCADPCKFQEGYCNMETGARYGDAESAERANCRVATQEEIDAAIAGATVSKEFPPYQYNIVYLPWHRIPE